MESILEQLREAGLTAKPSKCQFAMKECIYLGHVVGGGIIRPEVSKVEAVRRWVVPQTKKQVRALVGLTGYYRKFIPHYATIAAALGDLTCKFSLAKTQWSKVSEKAFQRLKEILCSSPVLHSPCLDKPLILQTDASNRGVGTVLSQTSGQGEEHPIAYFSRKLLPHEVNYSTMEECLAMKLGIQASRVYLLGRPFLKFRPIIIH